MLSVPNLSQRLNANLVVVSAGVTASLVWLDSAIPAAGLWMLVGLTATVGFVHGALDMQLMQQRFTGIATVLGCSLGYLLAVLLLTWLLSDVVEIALWLLLLMSAWHFGEPYSRWNCLPLTAKVFTRYVVGGAPIMLPVLFSPGSLAQSLQPALSSHAIDMWNGLAMGWLSLLLIWALFYAVRLYPAARYAWYELAGVLLLNVVFSPVMAFALYFGFYHSPAHIWRVGRSQSRKITLTSVAVVAGIFVMTLLLSAILWQLLGQTFVNSADVTQAVRWLIIVLAALSLPHLVLVSLCARLLTASADK
jgi:beta-carotene 15,15'-dioxygenase